MFTPEFKQSFKTFLKTNWLSILLLIVLYNGVSTLETWRKNWIYATQIELMLMSGQSAKQQTDDSVQR